MPQQANRPLPSTNKPHEDSEAEVIHRMVEYMKEFLEKPDQVFRGLPICPFARKARLENRILYKVHRFAMSPDVAEMEMIQKFCQEPNYEVLLVMHPEKQALTPLQMQKFLEKLNAKIASTGLVAFGGHPYEDFQIQGIYTRQEPYLNFTVQFQQRLKDASDLLLRTTSYYQNWTAENLRDVGIPRESNCS